MSAVLFTPLFLPNIAFFQEMVQYHTLFYDTRQGFDKQSFLNRTYILTANGPMRLVIPVQKGKTQMLYQDVQIIYRENWPKLHLKSMETAYRKSAFFEHYMPMLNELYEKKFKFLADFNLAGMEMLSSMLNLRGIEKWKGEKVKQDLRPLFHPKKPVSNTLKTQVYFQVFSDRMPFQPNLSIIDLLFNTGPEAIAYLKNYE